MLKIVIISSFAFTAQADTCARHTGGSCRFFGCDASRGPTVCSNGVCDCKPGFCSTKGVCTIDKAEEKSKIPTPSGPNGEWSLEQCRAAFDEECYKDADAPYQTCCHADRCMAASSSYTCKWNFNLPCCGLMFDEDTSFTYEAEDEQDCSKACSLLGRELNLATDYCPDGELERKLHQEAPNCPAALKHLKQVQKNELGNSKWGGTCSAHFENSCAWNYTMWHNDKTSYTALGNFQFHSEPGCFTACDALGNAHKRPDEFCGEAKTLYLDGCPAAKASFEASNRAWCDDNATADSFLVQNGGVIANQNVVKHADVRAKTQQILETMEQPQSKAVLFEANPNKHFCQQSWDAKCFNKKPFTDCCACNQSAGTHFSCDWDYTFSRGDVRETIGMKLSYFHGQSCDQVCEVLGNPNNDPNDYYCHEDRMTAIFDAGGGCPEAKKQWGPGTKNDPTWCKGVTQSTTLAQRQTFGYASLAGALGLMVALGLVLRLKSRAPTDDNYQPFLQ